MNLEAGDFAIVNILGQEHSIYIFYDVDRVLAFVSLNDPKVVGYFSRTSCHFYPEAVDIFELDTEEHPISVIEVVHEFTKGDTVTLQI